MESNLASAPEPSAPSLSSYNADDGANSTQDGSVPNSFCCENCIPVDVITVPNGAVSQTEGDSSCECDNNSSPTVLLEGGYNPQHYYSPYNNSEEPLDPYICQRCLLENTATCACTADWRARQEHGNCENDFPTNMGREFKVAKSSSNTSCCNCQAQKKRKARGKKSTAMPTVVIVVLNKPSDAGQYSCDMSPGFNAIPPQKIPQVQFQLPPYGSQQPSPFGNMPGQDFKQFCSHQVYQPGLNSMNQEAKGHRKTRQSKTLNEVDKAVLGILQNENYLCLLPDLAKKSMKKKKLRSPFDRFANPPILYEPKLFVPSCNCCNSCCCSRSCNSCCNSSFCW